MTKKHFQALAMALKFTRPIDLGITETMAARLRQWQYDVRNMANVCKMFNSKFSYERFLRACDYYDEGEKNMKVLTRQEFMSE